MMLKFVVDAREDDVGGVTRLLHVAQTGFLGVLECDASCGTTSRFFGGFWGVMLTFVADAREDDGVGVTRLLHVARTGFLGGSGV